MNTWNNAEGTDPLENSPKPLAPQLPVPEQSEKVADRERSSRCCERGSPRGSCLLGVARRTKTSWWKCSLTFCAQPPGPLRERLCEVMLEKVLNMGPEALSYSGSATFSASLTLSFLTCSVGITTMPTSPGCFRVMEETEESEERELKEATDVFAR